MQIVVCGAIQIAEETVEASPCGGVFPVTETYVPPGTHIAVTAQQQQQSETYRTGPGALEQNQHSRELISARNMSHKHNNKDLSRLR